MEGLARGAGRVRAASHLKAIAAMQAGEFADEITPVDVVERLAEPRHRRGDVEHPHGQPRRRPAPDTTLEALAKLKPVFAAKGSVTAGNSSQTSDGAGALILASEAAVKQFDLKPLARFVSYASRGVPPEIMGIGPIEAIPAALRLAGLQAQDDIDWIELNEAFAAQSLAVIDNLGLDPAKVNPMGGAIALGHPLGATGAIRSATVVHALRRKNLKYGMVTMCVGTGRARRASSSASDLTRHGSRDSSRRLALRPTAVRSRCACSCRAASAPWRVVIGGAMGVRQDYYAAFAQWLAAPGLARRHLRLPRLRRFAAAGAACAASRPTCSTGRATSTPRSTRSGAPPRCAAVPDRPQPGRAAAGAAGHRDRIAGLVSRGGRQRLLARQRAAAQAHGALFLVRAGAARRGDRRLLSGRALGKVGDLPRGVVLQWRQVVPEPALPRRRRRRAVREQFANAASRSWRCRSPTTS